MQVGQNIVPPGTNTRGTPAQALSVPCETTGPMCRLAIESAGGIQPWRIFAGMNCDQRGVFHVEHSGAEPNHHSELHITKVKSINRQAESLSYLRGGFDSESVVPG